MAKETLIIFGKYFGYSVGGAEASTVAMLQAREALGCEIHAVIVDTVKGFGSKQLETKLPESWKIHRLSLPFDLRRFKYVDYLLNRRAITDFFQKRCPQGRLLAYGLLAPAALKAHRGTSTYIIRDEWGLGVDANYYHGVKRWVREAYRVSELPFRTIWFSDLKKGVAKSDQIIANSRFMAEKAIRVFGQKALHVEYPFIDEKQLTRDWSTLRKNRPKQNPTAVCVGNVALKGYDIVLALAKMRPDITFEVFDRSFQEVKRDANLVFRPWVKTSAELLSNADLVLVPSRCNEGFSRLVREAKILNLPVLASRLGGIPEAADYPKSTSPHRLVSEVDNLQEWQTQLKELIQTP